MLNMPKSASKNKQMHADMQNIHMITNSAKAQSSLSTLTDVNTSNVLNKQSNIAKKQAKTVSRLFLRRLIYTSVLGE